jgi:hypothetical protein
MDNVTVYAGTVSSLIIQDLTYTWINAGDNNNYQIEYLDDTTAGNETCTFAEPVITIHMQNGVSTANQIKAAFEANVNVAGNIGVTVSGTGTNAQNAVAATNFTGGSWPAQKFAAYFTGDVYIQGALSFTGAISLGAISSFGTYTLTSGGGVKSIDTLITQPTVGDNVTITSGDLIAVNTAMLMQVGTNSNITTDFVGLAALGLPAVLQIGSGSYVDRIYGALFALSLGGGGGTIDEVGLCKSIAIPDGVTTVNRLYGYLMDLPFGDPGTQTWGVYIKNACPSWFNESVKIGGTSGSTDVPTNTSVALEIESTTRAFVNARMTTAERDALTAINGMQLYNTTTNKLQVYAGGSWVDLH